MSNFLCWYISHSLMLKLSVTVKRLFSTHTPWPADTPTVYVINRPLNVHQKHSTLRLTAAFSSAYEGAVCVPQRSFAERECCRLVECVSRQAGSASGFWKEDVTVLLLTSVAGIVLCYASQGFCSIIGAWFITLFCGGVCALTAEPSAPNLCIAWGFVVCVYSSICAVWFAILCVSTCRNVAVCLNE